MNFHPLNVAGPPREKSATRTGSALAVTAMVLLVLVWSYWTTLTTMAERWSTDPQYSHGFLVPIFALVVLWHRRCQRALVWEPSWWGLPLLLAGVSLRLFAIRRDLQPLDGFSLLPTLFGLVLLVGGKTVLRWSWPALAFLAFMVPLPFFIEGALAQPLRSLATTMSTYLLQTFGYPAISEGNIILIDHVKLGVADACSGLGMLATFLALATAMALVARAPLIDRLVLIASAAPIALVANVARITATGIAKYDDLTLVDVHALFGWLMMPFALLLLSLELRFLGRLFLSRKDQDAAPLAIPGLSLKG